MKKLSLICLSVLAMVFSSCSLIKKEATLEEFNKLIIHRAVMSSLEKSSIKLDDSFSYSYDLKVIGDVKYKDSISGKVDLIIKGGDAIKKEEHKKIEKALLGFSIDGFSGHADVTGTIHALGVEVDVDEHFDF